jgi:outer membrane protein assembly factor BamB
MEMPPEIQQYQWRMYRASVASAVIAGVFSLTVLASMVYDHMRVVRLDPINTPQLAAMRETLDAQPGNEALKKDIRLLDQGIRRQAAAVQERIETGRYLLLAGVAIMLLSAGLAVAARKSPPRPPKVGQTSAPAPKPMPIAAPPTGGGARGLWTMGGFVVLVGAAALVAMRFSGGPVWQDKPRPATNAAAENLPSAQEFARNWPMFRGPGGLGISTAKNVPTKWDGKTGEGILWKAPVPLPGRSSPIVWGARVFLTGATKETRVVFCFDANTGKVLWQRAVNGKAPPPPGPNNPGELTGFAAPTPATDGLRVYALFANGDIAGFDLAGKQLWVKNLGYPVSDYGMSASLAVYKGRVIVQYDQGGQNDRKSALIALDGATGQVAWTTPRAVDNSWTSPILIDTGGQVELVTSANPATIAYDPADGAELWRAESGLGKDLATSPAYAGNTVLVASKADTSIIKGAVAVSVGGQAGPPGHIAWTEDKIAADVPSPLGIGDAFLVVHSGGDAVLCDAATGKTIWTRTLPVESNYYASPILAEGRVYLFDCKGGCVILKASREYQQLGRCEFDEACETTPAIVEGKIFLRCEKNLYCIGAGK